MIIDTHCHLNLEPIYSDNGNQPDAWQHHWQKAQEHGVEAAVVVGTLVSSSQTAVEIAGQHDRLWAAVGVHPNAYSNPELIQTFGGQSDQRELGSMAAHILRDEQALTQLIENDQKKNIVAIGETGLDYFRLDRTSPDFSDRRDAQLSALSMHIRLANQFQLPLILHVRDTEVPTNPTTGNAYWDTLQLIESEYERRRPAILHCVSGPPAYVAKMVELGAYVSLAGNATYPKAEPIHQLAAAVPSDKLLVETDVPYLTPQPFRGQSCEPWMITATHQLVTSSFEADPTKNAKKLFGFTY